MRTKNTSHNNITKNSQEIMSGRHAGKMLQHMTVLLSSNMEKAKWCLNMRISTYSNIQQKKTKI